MKRKRKRRRRRRKCSGEVDDKWNIRAGAFLWRGRRKEQEAEMGR